MPHTKIKALCLAILKMKSIILFILEGVQPEFRLEPMSLNKIDRASCKEHPCHVLSSDVEGIVAYVNC